MKHILLFVAALVLVSGAAGIQPAEVENTTLRLELNTSEVFRSGLQTTPGEYQPSDYPYLSSSNPEALVPYGDTTELTNIYMPDGLVAYYPLDETTGNTANDITTTHPNNDGSHISLNQNNLGAKGSISTAYEFDGNSDYVNTGLNFDKRDLTYAAWFKPRETGGKGSIVSSYETSSSEWVRIAIFENNLRFSVDNNNNKEVITGSSPSVNEWHHVAATRSGGNMKIFFDGNLDEVGSTPETDVVDGLAPEVIGTLGSNAVGEGFNGVIDDVRIYNRSLSQKEVQRLYNYQNKDQPGTEQISATITSGGFVLANTKGGTPSIESRNEAVRSRTFLSQVSPSFGFPLPQSPTTTNIVYQSPYNLTGDSFSSTSSSISLRSTTGLGENATVAVRPTG